MNPQPCTHKVHVLVTRLAGGSKIRNEVLILSQFYRYTESIFHIHATTCLNELTKNDAVWQHTLNSLKIMANITR